MGAPNFEQVAFTALVLIVFAVNFLPTLQSAFRLNRPMPMTDGLTLLFLIVGGVLVCAQGLFEFRLDNFVPATAAKVIYAIIGLSTAWQASRQR